MNMTTMLSDLGIAMEDTGEDLFDSDTKVRALNHGQTSLAAMLHPAYLTELEYVDTSQSAVSGVLALSSLTYTVLNGAEGIIAINVSSGVRILPLTHDDLKSEENYYLAGQSYEPRYYIEHAKIKLRPASTATIDVAYRKVPDTLSAAGSDCALNAAFHPQVVTLAEAELWRSDRKFDRAEAAQKAVIDHVAVLNARYTPVK